jgi:hypothetical protein
MIRNEARTLAIKSQQRTYHGPACRACGGTERYTSNRKCVPCKGRLNSLAYEAAKNSETREQAKARLAARDARVASKTAKHEKRLDEIERDPRAALNAIYVEAGYGPPTDEQWAAQMEQSAAQRRLGMNRFDVRNAGKDFERTDIGSRVIADIAAPLITRFRSLQGDLLHTLATSLAVDALETFGGSEADEDKPEALQAVILASLSAEKLATITAFTMATHAAEGMSSRRTVANSLGDAVREEIEMQRWVRIEEQAAKAATGDHVNLAELMRRRNSEVDRRVYDKWKRKSALFVGVEWTYRTRQLIGGWLLAHAIESDAWFVLVRLNGTRGDSYTLAFTEDARSYMGHAIELLRNSRPVTGMLFAPPLPVHEGPDGTLMCGDPCAPHALVKRQRPYLRTAD